MREFTQDYCYNNYTDLSYAQIRAHTNTAYVGARSQGQVH